MGKRTYGKDCKVLWKDTKRWCGLPLSFTHYSIVEKPNRWIKLFIERGILATQIEEIQLYRIDDFSIYESLSNKLWGVGNIELYVNDANQEKETLCRIKNPYKLYDLLAELVEKDRQTKNLSHAEFQH